jgi:DNA (cytosine-5)-methyltransferase 1
MGYKKGTKLYQKAQKATATEWLTKDGVLADAFPVEAGLVPHEITLEGTYAEITDQFSSHKPSLSPFTSAGLVIDRKVVTGIVNPRYDGPQATLGDIIIDEKDVPQEFFISEEKLPMWIYLKGAKKEERKTTSGHTYHYAEGAMVFPDTLDKPSRTIITGEGGGGASRFKHVVQTPSGRLRRLVPLKLERLDMFPDNHTKLETVSDSKRAFFMGNALVVGAIEKVGQSLSKKTLAAD